jgi:hypothetical protein
MIFGESLPMVEGVAPVYSLHCDYCGRELIGESKVKAVLQALRHGWKIKLQFFAPETEFIGLADLIRALDSNDTFCPACLKKEFI